MSSTIRLAVITLFALLPATSSLAQAPGYVQVKLPATNSFCHRRQRIEGLSKALNLTIWEDFLQIEAHDFAV